MLVNEWVETVWKVLQVRPKTIHDYKRLYRRHLEPVIGNLELKNVDPALIQRKLLTLPPPTARHIRSQEVLNRVTNLCLIFLNNLSTIAGCFWQISDITLYKQEYLINLVLIHHTLFSVHLLN